MGVPLWVRYGVPARTPTFDAAYTWDNLGRMTGTTIPNGPVYQYQYDAMSNLSTILQQFTGEGGPWTSPVASAQYNWAGQRTSLSYTFGFPGNPSAFQYTETRSYNGLLQLGRLTTTCQVYGGQAPCGGGTVIDDEYLYQAGQNNGRIVQSVDHVRGETVNFTYDALNRLLSAEEVSGKWGNAFSYDGWGTLNGQTWTPGQAAAPGTVTRGPSDANGNLLAPPGGSGGTYTWD